ncbi:MAG TPA: branched-chain amino acid ABC transporter permease [Candidatus Acidoferrales bacterium]|jgi:branched-chain amino acid transport system permease protein|nr:branched-chain amino acid ABC transporter permease [Candidatus Acidoferrales bacterium]
MNFNRAKTFLLAAVALCFVISLFEKNINSYWLSVCYDIGINIILAVSLNLINGYTGQFSLGHAGFMAVGAYTAAAITNQFTGSNPALADATFLGALLAGGLLAAVAGLLVGIPTLRLRGDYLAIVTLGFGEIIRVILQNMDAVGGPRGYSVMHNWTNFFWAFAIAAVTIYTILALVHSTYGRGFIAVQDDEIAAAAVGINPTKYKVTAFVVGAFFAGIAGGLYAHAKYFISPDGFGFMKSIEIVVMVILGGMGNTPGVILAAILLTLLPEGLRSLADVPSLPGISTQYPLSWIGNTRMIIYSLLLVVIMLIRPQGLFVFKKDKASCR